jgi:integrase
MPERPDSSWRLVKHRGQWSLAFGRPRQRLATGTNDRARAEAIASEIWRRLNRPVEERLSDLFATYSADRVAAGAAKGRMDSLWRQIEPSFGHKFGPAVTKDDCRAYTARRRRERKSDSTIRTELELLRAILRWHYGDAAPKIVAPPPAKPRDRFLTKDERERLLASIETPHAKLFTILALTTGARMGAILDLTWERVDLKAGTIDFEPAGRERSRKRRTVVPINARARAALEEARQGALSDFVIEYGGKPVASVKKAIAAAARRSGIRCSPHDFRRSAARWMAEADVSMERIAQFLGHTSTRVTYATYARFSPRYMADAAQALDW